MRVTSVVDRPNGAIARAMCWLEDKIVAMLSFDSLFDPALELQLSPQATGRDCGKTEPCETDADTDEHLEAINITKDSIVALHVELALTSEERRRGLLGRRSMRAGEGLYIVPTQWIHMFGMRFAIDVAFLSSSGRVLRIHHNLKPNRLSRIAWRAEGALELPTGTLRASQTEVGDIIELREPTDESRSRKLF